MTNNTILTLTRDVDAYLIPSGARIYLQQGTEVSITQALGDSYTVNIYGNLARIDGKDADALGKEPTIVPQEIPAGTTLNEMVWQQLKTCYDPEIPVNIVDLGLIYNCELLKVPGKEEYRVDVTMTLTAPGCGMGPVLADDVKRKLSSLPTIAEVNVEIVFDPPWDRNMMSDVAKLELGMF